jgi:hypothetical protein
MLTLVTTILAPIRLVPASPALGSAAPDNFGVGYPRKNRMSENTMSGNAMTNVSPMSWSAMKGMTPR